MKKAGIWQRDPEKWSQEMKSIPPLAGVFRSGQVKPYERQISDHKRRIAVQIRKVIKDKGPMNRIKPGTL